MSDRSNAASARPAPRSAGPDSVRVGRLRTAALAKKASKPSAPKAKAAKTSSKQSQPEPEPKNRPARPAVHKARPGATSPAVVQLERALERFRKQDWKGAREELSSGIEGFPGEAEVVERMRSYLSICDRQLAPKAVEPKSPEDQYQVGILRLNAGALDEAVGYLQKALSSSARSEASHYALACAFALRNDRATALKHLKSAIELNAENRIHASADSDFELLRDDAEFAALVASGHAPGRGAVGGGD